VIQLKSKKVILSFDDGHVEMGNVLWACQSATKPGVLNVGLRTESKPLQIVILDGDGRDDRLGVLVTSS
jgi:hypothetical protein